MAITSLSTLDGDGNRWSLIRETDTHPGTGSLYTKWYVMGTTGLYGPYQENEGEQRARELLAEKVGVPNAAGLIADTPAVEPIGPSAPDNDA
jgi:hypothetical protein